jgi:hypothetical protein
MFRMFLLLFSLFQLSSCQDFELETPNGFIELDSRTYDYQATNAASVVFAVRSLGARGAEQAFWHDVVSTQLQRLGGYSLEHEVEVTTKDGTHGKLLTFYRQEGGKRHVYSIATFVKHDSIAFIDRRRLFVVESGGEAQAYEAASGSLLASLQSLELDLPL